MSCSVVQCVSTGWFLVALYLLLPSTDNHKFHPVYIPLVSYAGQRLLSLSKQALVQAENPEHCAEQELPGSEGRATYDQAAAHLRPVDERLWAEYDRRGCRS